MSVFFATASFQLYNSLNVRIGSLNGVLPHNANPMKPLLKRHFENARIISCHFPTALLSRSSYLNMCDFWLWGYLKDVVFRLQTQLNGRLTFRNIFWTWSRRHCDQLWKMLFSISTSCRKQYAAYWTCFESISQN